MANACAATADITPIPPNTDKTMPNIFKRVLTTCVVPGAACDADDADDADADDADDADDTGVPPAPALIPLPTEEAVDDIL